MPGVKLDGIEFNYVEQGGGEETVVFGHGASNSARGWRAVWELLPATYHAFALDFRGHGESAQVTENITIAQMADDVYRFSRELGLGRFIYVGLSMGGGVGIQLAVDHPEVLKALVLVSTVPAHGLAIPPDQREKRRTSRRNRETVRALLESIAAGPIPEEFMQERVDDYMRTKEEVYLSVFDSLEHFNQEAHLGEIKVPTLMLIGGKDILVPPEEQYRTARGIPGAKPVLLEGDGHLIQLEDPQEIVNQLTSFVARLT